MRTTSETPAKSWSVAAEQDYYRLRDLWHRRKGRSDERHCYYEMAIQYLVESHPKH